MIDKSSGNRIFFFFSEFSLTRLKIYLRDVNSRAAIRSIDLPRQVLLNQFLQKSEKSMFTIAKYNVPILSHLISPGKQSALGAY